jgi:hypothetical protein
MDEQPYPFQRDSVEYSYRFESVNGQTVVQKLVLITATGRANIYNLALLDELPDGELSDTVVTNNKDMPTVLATVFSIVADFLDRFPDYALVFRGSDARRDRLYRMVLGREFVRLNQVYEIFGFDGNQFVLFEANGSYQFFLIRKRL